MVACSAAQEPLTPQRSWQEAVIKPCPSHSNQTNEENQSENHHPDFFIFLHWLHRFHQRSRDVAEPLPAECLPRGPGAPGGLGIRLSAPWDSTWEPFGTDACAIGRARLSSCAFQSLSLHLRRLKIRPADGLRAAPITVFHVSWRTFTLPLLGIRQPSKSGP